LASITETGANANLIEYENETGKKATPIMKNLAKQKDEIGLFHIYSLSDMNIINNFFFLKKKLDIALARLFHAIQHQHDGSIISEAVKNTVPKLIDLNSATKERLLEKIQEHKVVNYLYYYCAYFYSW